MADTKKGGSGGGNSIVWSWREVDVRHCTCMSVQAGMYCGTIQVPDGEPPITGSCGTHCWDLGYVDAETEYFISKGFPVCGGPDAPPLPDPILWPEFPTLTDLNTDEVPPCQRRATGLAFMQQAGLQSELQDQIFQSVGTYVQGGTDVQGEYSGIDMLPIPQNLLDGNDEGDIWYSVSTGSGRECQCKTSVGISPRTGKPMATIAAGCCGPATCWVLKIKTYSSGGWGPQQAFSTCTQGTGLRGTSPQLFEGGDLNDLFKLLCGGKSPCPWRPLSTSPQM